MTLARMIELLKPLGYPLFFAPRGFRIIPAFDTDAQRVSEIGSRSEQIRALAVDLGVFLVPEDVAPLGIEEHDALRQDVDRFAQARV